MAMDASCSTSAPVEKKPLSALQQRMLKSQEKVVFSLAPNAIYRIKVLMDSYNQSAEQKGEERKYYDRFDNLDNIAHGDRGGERVGASRSAYIPPPTSAAWYSSNVALPQRMALLTMACIMGYEVLVFASMGVRSLRWMMNDWLMYLMLAVNVLMMIILAAFVFIRRRDSHAEYTEKVKDVATGRGKEKLEYTV